MFSTFVILLSIGLIHSVYFINLKFMRRGVVGVFALFQRIFYNLVAQNHKKDDHYNFVVIFLTYFWYVLNTFIVFSCYWAKYDSFSIMIIMIVRKILRSNV